MNDSPAYDGGIVRRENVMVLEDFHVHTAFSDGKSTPEEVVQAALRKGMTRLGFSDHSYTSFDLCCCVPMGQLLERRRAMEALKEKYQDRIALFCGIEQELYSDLPAEGYDYVIGSAHYLLLDGEYHSVDHSPEALLETAERFFGGDFYALAEEYFRTEAQVVERTGCDIIGHFDLISKFNEKQPLFDPAHPRYVAAWRAAADALLESGSVFEINTGAMSRGWRSAPYPAADILAYLRDRGARFVLSSDSHSAANLCFGFAEQRENAKRAGLELIRFPLSVD